MIMAYARQLPDGLPMAERYTSPLTIRRRAVSDKGPGAHGDQDFCLNACCAYDRESFGSRAEGFITRPYLMKI